MLRLERESLREVVVEIGGSLARDPVDEIERDVVEAGLAQGVYGAPHLVRRGLPLEHVEQAGLEGLCAQRHARHTVRAEKSGDVRRDRLGIGLDRDLLPRGEAPASRRSSSLGAR